MTEADTTHPGAEGTPSAPSTEAALGRAPLRHLVLDFADEDEDLGDDEGMREDDGSALAIHKDISCVTIVERTLFCSCDEGARIERLVISEDGSRAGHHRTLHLGRIFDLPGGPGGEMDIEGLAVDDGYLWICGSQSLKRGKPDARSAAEDPPGLKRIKWDPNRGFLGRVPLAPASDGHLMPVAVHTDADGRVRRAAMLAMGRRPRHSRIRRLVARDPRLRPFLRLPAKENGFDIEGLAVSGGTVLLGLRGPVIGNHGLVVRIEVEEARAGRLKLRRLADGRRHAVHALDLAGQGVRDLWWQDGRLFVLSGAAGAVDTLQTVFEIDHFDGGTALLTADDRKAVLELPAVRVHDNAEGLALFSENGEERVLIVYDSPHPRRLTGGERRLLCDVFDHD